MSWIKIAYKNFTHNMKLYTMHVSTLAAIIAIFYNFVALKESPEVFSSQTYAAYIEALASMAAVLIGIFVIFFLWYSSTYFLNQRKKELGLFTLMGVSQQIVAKIYVVEYILMTLVALVAGEFAGAMLGKFFAMILAKISFNNVVIHFFISWQSIVTTSVTILIVVFVLAIKDYIKIRSMALIKLIKGKNKEERVKGSSRVAGIMGLIFISLGYYLSYTCQGPQFVGRALPILIITCVGTFIFFRGTLVMILNQLKKIPSFYRKRTNSFLVSQLAHRIGQNYRMFAIIAILSGSTITCISTSISMVYAAKEEEKYNMPYSINYMASEEDMAQINGELEKMGAVPDQKIVIPYLVSKLGEDDPTWSMQYIIKASDFKKVQQFLGYSSIELTNLYQIKDDEGFIITKSETVMSISDVDEIEEIDPKLTNIGTFRHALFGKGTFGNTSVISDKTYERIANEQKDSYMDMRFVGMQIENEDNVNYEKFKTFSEETNSKFTKENPTLIVSRLRSYNEDTAFRLMSLFFFVGAFIALVLIIATGSILYFKVLTDAYTDQQAMEVLVKIGLSDKEFNKLIREQVGLYFWLPLILGLLHSFFAIKTLSNLISMSLLMPLYTGVLAFIVIYLIYYFLAVRQYRKLLHIQMY